MSKTIAPAVFTAQPTIEITKGDHNEKLRKWEEELAQVMGLKIAMMHNETISGSGRGWDDSKYDEP